MNNYDEKDGVWRTVGGRRIFIRNGQSLSEAMIESGKFGNQVETEKPSMKYHDDVEFICKIRDKNLIEKSIGKKLKNDDIVFTNERNDHVSSSRVGDEIDVKSWIKETLITYDEIYHEVKKGKDDIVFVKRTNFPLFAFVFVAVSVESECEANSIISARFMNQKKYEKYTQKNKLLKKRVK